MSFVQRLRQRGGWRFLLYGFGAFGIALVLMGLQTLMAPDPDEVDANGTLYKVGRGELVVSVLERGNLKALRSQDIRSQVQGSTTLISIVDEGTLITEADVAAGKILVELDSSALEDKATQQHIKVNDARSAFNQATEDLLIELKQNESDINAGELKVKFAWMDLEKYVGAGLARQILQNKKNAYDRLIAGQALDGEALQKKRYLETDIDLAREEVTRAQNKLKWTETLHAKGYVTRDELEADTLSLKRKGVELERAQTARELFIKYDFAKETERLLSNYREAERELERITARAKSKEARARAKEASRRLNYELQNSKLQKLLDQVEKCVIRATQPGLVVYAAQGGWRRRQEPIEAGMTVRERQALIRLPDLSEMAVEVKVIESAVKKVKAGQQVKIKLDAYPDLALTGKVTKVAAVADSQVSWMNPDLKVYTTEVLVQGRHPYLKPGLTASVEIIAEVLADVLLVPAQAVFALKEQSVCYVDKGGHYEARPVLMGSANDRFVQIVAGLEGGEAILLHEPAAGARIKKVAPEFDTATRPRPF